MTIDRIDKELAAVKELLEGFQTMLQSLESIPEHDRELRDYNLLRDMRAKCEAIEERIERWYDGE